MWAVVILFYFIGFHQAVPSEIQVPSTNVIWSESFGRWSKFKSFLDWHDQPIYKSKSTHFKYLYSRPVRKASNWSIAYNYKKKLLYWIDESMPKKIYIQPASQSFDWTLQETPSIMEMKNKEISMKELVVDWSTDNIYATDPHRKAIVLIQSSNKTKTHVFTKEVPENLCIDSQKGVLLWSEKNRIMKIDTSGTNVVEEFVAQTDISSLSMFKNKKNNLMMLWVDPEKGLLMVCEIGKTDCRGIYSYDKNMNDYKASAVFKNHVFLTNVKSLSIDVISLSSYQMIQSFEIDAMPHNIVSDPTNDSNPPHDCQTMKCEHFCVNKGEGKGICSCMDGYYLALDGISCEASESLFIYTTLHDINVANPNTKLPIENPKNLEVSITSLNIEERCSTLNYHYDEKKLFYSKVNDDSIYALDVSSNVALLGGQAVDGSVDQVTAQVGRLTGLAVNWKDSILLWMDGDMGYIMASRFNGRHHSIVRINLKGPEGLATDAYRGIIFWSEETNSKRRICEGFVKVDDLEDKDEKKCFFDMQDNSLDDMVYDPQNNRLYISTRLTKTITSIDLATRKTRSYVVNNHSVHQFTVFQDIMVLAQGGTQPLLFVKQPSISNQSSLDSNKAISVTSMEGVKFVAKGAKTVSWIDVTDLVLFTPYLQPKNPVSSCSSANPCRQLCSSFSHSHQCLCAIGYHGVNCESEIINVPALYFLDIFHKQLYQLNLKDNGLFEPFDQPKSFIPPNLIDKIHSYPHSFFNAPRSFVVDETTNLIYVLDGPSIKVFDPATEKIDTVFHNTEAQLDITQMSLDEKGRILYFTSASQGTIHALDLNNNKLKLWMERLSKPEAIFVSKDSKRIYWSERSLLYVSISLKPIKTVISYELSQTLDPITAVYEHVCEDKESNHCDHVFVATLTKILKINITSLIESPQTTPTRQKRDFHGVSILYDRWQSNVKVYGINSIFVHQYHLYFSAVYNRTVYRLNLNESSELDSFPVPLFAQISHIQLIQSKSLKQESSTVVTTIIIAAVVAALLLLLLLCLLCLLCCYFMKRRQPKEKVHVVASTSTSATTLPSSRDEVWDSNEMVSDHMVVPGIYRQNLTSNNKEISELTLNVDMFKDGSYIVDNTNGTLVSRKATTLNGLNKMPEFINGNDPEFTNGIYPEVTNGPNPELTNGTKSELNSLRQVKNNQEVRPLPAVPSTPKTPNPPPPLKPTPPTPPPPLNKNVCPSLIKSQEQKAPYNKPPQDTKQFLSLFSSPPKLHTEPRGFAPASHARPAPVKSTWGRKKFNQK